MILYQDGSVSPLFQQAIFPHGVLLPFFILIWINFLFILGSQLKLMFLSKKCKSKLTSFQNIEYFRNMYCREVVLFLLLYSPLVDIWPFVCVAVSVFTSKSPNIMLWQRWLVLHQYLFFPSKKWKFSKVHITYGITMYNFL